MKRYAFIYNPAAGSGRTEYPFRELKFLIAEKENYSLFLSESPDGISDIINDIWSEYDVFIACGGDGTVRDVASNIINSEKILGIIPIGTGNDLSKTLKIPKNLNSAFGLIQQGYVQTIDAGQCNDFIFLNTLGFGFDGLANRYAIDYVKLPSFLRYMVAAIKAGLSHNIFSAEITYSNHTAKENLIMFSLANGRVEGGNFWIAPNASITDGKLKLVKIRPVPKVLIPILLPLIRFKKPHWIPYFNSRNIETLAVSFDENMDIHADGEIINTSEKKFHIKVIPGALKVICSK